MTSNVARKLFDALLDLSLSRRQQERLGRHIADRANADNNDDSTLNGEYRVCDIVRQALSKQPAVIFDVGANIGAWTERFATLDNPRLAVHAFEPCPPTYQKLHERISRLEHSVRVNLIDAGLSDHEGSAEFFTYGPLAGANSLHQRSGVELESDGRMQIRLLRGDNFCTQHGIERIDFMKIDVEGHEMAVLRGLARMLAEGRIGCILFEYGGTWIDARSFLGDAFALLLPMGYRIGKIYPRGVRLLDRYDQKLDNFAYGNYLAMRPEWTGRFGDVSG